jgi:hypothetical protein
VQNKIFLISNIYSTFIEYLLFRRHTLETARRNFGVWLEATSRARRVSSVLHPCHEEMTSICPLIRDPRDKKEASGFSKHLKSSPSRHFKNRTALSERLAAACPPSSALAPLEATLPRRRPPSLSARRAAHRPSLPIDVRSSSWLLLSGVGRSVRRRPSSSAARPAGLRP